jgi:hypothetical protein
MRLNQKTYVVVRTTVSGQSHAFAGCAIPRCGFGRVASRFELSVFENLILQLASWGSAAASVLLA